MQQGGSGVQTIGMDIFGEPRALAWIFQFKDYPSE